MIGLAAGEPPTTKGYPGRFNFSLKLLCWAGSKRKDQGSITGLFSVLVEMMTQNGEPIAVYSSK